MPLDDSPSPLPESASKERISVSLSPGQKSDLQRIAAEKKVSLAWVIRDAVDAYLASQASNE